MTEDMVEEQQLIFEGLGTSPEAAIMRQKLQTSQLKSGVYLFWKRKKKEKQTNQKKKKKDMEAFKAANPGAEIEDFIQWHSPRDWITSEDSSQGSLSVRMQDEQNLWRQIWMVGLTF